MRNKIPVAFVLSMLILFSCITGISAEPQAEPLGTPRSTAIFWTDGPRLKALNLTFFPRHSGPVGIVSVPVYTCLGSNADSLTAAECYLKHGRDELIRRLEQLFDTPVETYISVDQQSLADASKVMGPVQMAGVSTNLADVFEGRYVNGPVNLQVEIRQLAGAVTTPEMLVKLPRTVWVFASRVDTNVGLGQFLYFFRLLAGAGPEMLQKKAVPGHDYLVDGCKYRRVEPETWARIVREVTTRN